MISRIFGTSLWLAASLGFTGLAGAQSYAPMPVPSGAPIPVNRTTDSAGNSYSVTGYALLKTTPAGTTTTMAASTITQAFGNAVVDYFITGVTVDGFDNVYAAERSNGLLTGITPAESILKITPAGARSVINVTAAGTAPSDRGPINCSITTDQDGNIFTVGVDGSIYQIKPDGTQVTLVLGSTWFYGAVGNFPNNSPGLAVDNQGNLFTNATNLNPSGNAGPVEFVRLTPQPLITLQPQGATIPFGTNRTLTVAAASTSALSYQWYLNGAPIVGASGPMTENNNAPPVLSASYSASLPGTYTVAISTAFGAVLSAPAVITTVTGGGVSVVAMPTITAQPTAAAIAYGDSALLSIAAVATGPISYQWQINGTDLPGTNVTSISANTPGTYSVKVTTSAGSVMSNAAVLTLANRPVNISSRAAVGTGSGISIAGFVVASYSGLNKQVLIRAVGPSLSTLGVNGVLAQPVLSVFDANGRLIATNTGWNNSATVAAAGTATGAFPLQTGSADSALVLDLAPGSYTAQVSGANGTTGVALVEVYEIAADASHFINISTRAAVGTGASILIGGLVAGGSQPSRMLVRAVGPGLAQMGVSGALAQPVLSVYDANGKLVAVNVGWSNGTSADAVAVASAATRTGAFALNPGSADCAMLLTLSPGAYTAQVTGVNGSTGIALVEAYHVPN